MGLFSFLFNLNNALEDSEKEERNKRIEQEMEWNNFDEHEKEEVRKGNYDVHNFEDSEDIELDEDDYYSEDNR